MLRSIGRILLVRDQGASPCVDSCIILETGAREGRKRRRRRKRRKKWMDLVLLFFCCESRRSRVDLSPRGDGRRYFRKFFNLACRRTLRDPPPPLLLLVLSTNTRRRCFFARDTTLLEKCPRHPRPRAV